MGLTAGRPDPVRCVEWAEVRSVLVESPKSSQAMPPALQFLVLTFAGWVNRHQDDLIAYLREEHRVLREHPRAAGAGYRPSVRRGSRLGNHFPAAGILRGPWPGRTADPCATGSQPAARSSYGEDLTMWKREEAVKPGSGQSTPTGQTAPSHGSASGLPQSEAGQQDGSNVVNVGKSVVIKGALHGSEDHTIEGQVEGTIKAQVFAKALVVLGAVNDTIAVSERGDIRDGGAVDSDIVSPRVAIAEGAYCCGRVDMPRQSVPSRQAQQPYNAVAWAAMTARRRRPATSPRVPRPLAGSYLWPGRDRRRTEGRCPATAASPACGREDHRHQARLTDGEVGWYCRLEVGS